MNDQRGDLLPVSKITAKLLEDVSLDSIAEDMLHDKDNPPEFWARLVAEGKKASQAPTLGFSSLLDLYIENSGNSGRNTGGYILKLIYIGWRAAEMYLQHLETEAEASQASNDDQGDGYKGDV